MFSHLRAVLLATATLVLAGTLHSVWAATVATQTTIALVPGSAPAAPSSQLRLVAVSPAGAIAH